MDDKTPLFRSMDSYDTEEDNSSDDELLPPDPKSTSTVLPQFPDPDDMSSSVNAPTDNYNAIYIIFFIQGIGMLLPWNFFITAKSYFEYKFKGDASLVKNDKFENAFALAAMFPNVISLFLNIFLTNKLSRGSRVITCLTVMFVTFAVTTILVKINTQSWPQNFFAITVCCVVVINISSGVYQGTLFGVAGIVGQRYIQAIMSGQATAGIFAALADLVSKLVARESLPTKSAFIYFLIATVVIVITAVSYTMLFKLPRMQFYFRKFQRHSERDLKARQVQIEKKKAPRIPYWQIYKQIMPMALSVLSVFSVTLTMFPAIIARIESVDKGSESRWSNDLFATVVCFLIFNAGDWCGRILAGSIQIVSERGIFLPILCLSRVIFIPLFLMCNVSGESLPYVFKHDFWPVIINVFFSVSNGYLGSLCMMFGPKLVAIEHAETAGTIMSLFLSLGLTLGACISFAF